MRNENEVEENEVERLVEVASRAIVALIGRGVTLADARPLARLEIERLIARGYGVESFVEAPRGAPVTECNMIAKSRMKTRAALSPVAVYGEEEATRVRYDAVTALGYFMMLAARRWRDAYDDLAAVLHSDN